MAGFDHRPARAEQDDLHPGRAARSARYGLILFSIYLAIYTAFVLINAFAPEFMDQTPAAGVSLSIFAGFSLIGAAFLLALIYGWLCRAGASTHRRDEEPGP
jgi:uncharacterized membrane protein (DUF485 family)